MLLLKQDQNLILDIEVRFRLDSIDNSLNQYLNSNNSDNEFLKYVPIAMVACFESFFRSIIKDLIDFGKPYSDNAIKFNQSKNVSFDFEIINAIQTKAVTIGEFISHILHCNNFNDINSNLSKLIDTDFISAIKKFERNSVFKNRNENSINFKKNYEKIIPDVIRTFELRHIFCHEIATNLKVEEEEIVKCFRSSRSFLTQVDEYISDLLYPEAPETQTDMNIKSQENFTLIDNELKELINKVKVCSSEDLIFDEELFDKTIIDWQNYRNSMAKLHSIDCRGGTMYPTVYAMELISITQDKIESLKNRYQRILKE